MLAAIVIMLGIFLAYVFGAKGDYTSVWIVVGIGLFLLFAIGVAHTADRADVNRMHYWAYGDDTGERRRRGYVETERNDTVRRVQSAPVQVNVNVMYEGARYDVKVLPAETKRAVTEEEARVRERLEKRAEERRKQWGQANKESEMTKLFGTWNVGA